MKSPRLYIQDLLKSVNTQKETSHVKNCEVLNFDIRELKDVTTVPLKLA